MNTRTQLACIYCGPFFATLLILGWAIAGFIPPHAPSAGAQEISGIYGGDVTRIRLGLMLMMASGGFFAPWVAIIYVYMRRMEDARFPVLSMTQVISGVYGIIVIIFPALLWTTAAFRPERDAELILLLNDLGWFNFLMVWSPAFVQTIAIGIAILQDSKTEPLIPRWIGYLNIWIAILYVPACLMTLFKRGPFAWNGILSFWIPAIAFFIWFVVMARALVQAVHREKIALMSEASPAPIQ